MKNWPKGPSGEAAKNAEDLAWALAQKHDLSWPSQVNAEAGLNMIVHSGVPLERAYDIVQDLVCNLVMYERDRKSAKVLREYRILWKNFFEKNAATRELCENLENDPNTFCVNFSCNPDDLGAYIRGVLWIEGLSFDLLVSGQRGIMVQEYNEKNKRWENLGDYDCAGLEISRGR